LNTTGFANAIDEGFAEGEEEEPFEVSGTDGFEFVKKEEGGDCYGCGKEQPEGHDDEDGDVAFGEKELFGNDETDAPDN
jgi:hypothetical protein